MVRSLVSLRARTLIGPRAIVGVGGGINWVSPYYRPFSLLDLTISYPTNFGDQQISVGVLIAFTLIAPGFVIFLVCLFFVPGPKATRRTPKSLVLRRKFWEWNTGWMGLGLSLASAFLITQGLKNLLGKPRPDMLSRCNPDLANIERYYVGGYGQTFNDRWMLVSVDICQQTDRAMLDDGFRSFPSGHSSCELTTHPTMGTALTPHKSPGRDCYTSPSSSHPSSRSPYPTFLHDPSRAVQHSQR